ncbi:MAG: esterase family protein [Cytophagaceae bacterium]|nr:esterase family protein [Cytophagaceae bacterium]MBL0301459.1 esterase family protein [Cytophagaceae bacterium]MBL0324280.1 esterase family protein [Cytophagaceae bacterium]
MKKLLILITLHLSLISFAQTGKVVSFTINSKALQNKGGEDPNRKVSVYLPPNYDASTQRYPVIYYLHGFMGKDNIFPQMQKVLDEGISRQKIKPFIFVQADQYTLFEGSFYSNSSLTGNWDEFESKELVEYLDKNYRTIPTRDSRGIAGHSMGGYGAFKIGMLHPEVFSSIYALSPGLLAMVKEFGPNSSSFKEVQNVKTIEDLKKTYYPKVLVAVGRAWSPNPNKPPFFCDFPFSYEGDKMIVNQAILEKWEANMPVYIVDKYADNLRKMSAIKLDWGRNDSPRFPLQIGMLSQRLENLGINHFAEEYIGDHGNKIWTLDGRVLNDMLPFFNDYLKF